jgi:hypothetical protein
MKCVAGLSAILLYSRPQRPSISLGCRSVNDPIDTTTSHGRLIFNIFASLAEFERDVVEHVRLQGGFVLT